MSNYYYPVRTNHRQLYHDKKTYNIDKVRIQFLEKGTSEIYYLVGMHRGGILKIDESDLAVLLVVARTGDWEFSENQVLIITITETWDPKWFSGRMIRPLGHIEILSQ